MNFVWQDITHFNLFQKVDVKENTVLIWLSLSDSPLNKHGRGTHAHMEMWQISKLENKRQMSRNAGEKRERFFLWWHIRNKSIN